MRYLQRMKRGGAPAITGPFLQKGKGTLPPVAMPMHHDHPEQEDTDTGVERQRSV